MEKEYHDQYIIIASPHLRVCEELSLRLRLEGQKSQFFTSRQTLLKSWTLGRPRLLLLDFALSEALQELGQKPWPPVLMLGNPAVAEAVSAMKRGASDVLTQPVDPDHFLRLVHWALSAPSVSTSPPSLTITADLTRLTKRERQVLQLIAEGQSNKEAGRELRISPRTIEVHRARFMEKLGARNTADLMRIVLGR